MVPNVAIMMSNGDEQPAAALKTFTEKANETIKKAAK